MADFLLIHGSCHGAWCWRDLIPALTALGHNARAIDLPGAGDDKTPFAEVTLASCGDAVLAASTPDTIVLGHSWGGHPIAAAAEANPGGMRALVFLCTYVPVTDRSMVDMRKGAKRQLIVDAVRRAADGLSYTIDPARVQDLFYHDCPPETLTFAAKHLCPQPIAPQTTPLSIGANFDTVPKAYIRTAFDHTIPLEYQVEMTFDWPDANVHTLSTSHSPFFADPAALAACLNTIAGRL